MVDPPYIFWPSEIGPYESDLNKLLASYKHSNSELLDCVLEHLSKFPQYPNAEEARLRYQAYLHVLADLLRQQWKAEVNQGRLFLSPPELKEVSDDTVIIKQKGVIRQSLSWERDAQFEQKSVQKFIKYMEEKHEFKDQLVSIHSLIADGSKLAGQLAPFEELPPNQFADVVMDVINPYLQLVTAEDYCEYTGLRLMDIWRYFRYTWATPYNSTPGRQMFYLVRDQSQPFHPVVGIAALGSSLVQLTVRDDSIGWTSKAFKKRLSEDSFDDNEAQTVISMLARTLTSAIEDIATDGLVESHEIDKPDSRIVDRLKRLYEQSRVERIKYLKCKNEMQRWEEEVKDSPDLEPPFDKSVEEWDQLAKEALYRAKRTKVLSKLLEAKIIWDFSRPDLNTANDLRNFYNTQPGHRTISTLITENKKKRVGINIMDIIVCGAVQPYNILLGGKLVAMLLAGPQTVADYRKKYQAHISNIASKLKGESVIREPKLVMLGTTSLYSVGSSQYNRISIPVQEDSDEQIRYIRYGLTKGYGSVHFSVTTRDSLYQLLLHVHGARLVNNEFGEGVNPKMRRLSAGLAAIGLQSVDNFVKHHSPRIVYGIPLGRKAYSFLRGEADDPAYYFDVTTPEAVAAQMDYIARNWATRWLKNRIKSKYLKRVAAFEIDDYLLSNELPTCKDTQNLNS